MDDPYANKRKADREDGRLKALEYAEEALLFDVAVMRDTSEDMKHRMAASARIQNRAWGTPKATPDEDPKIANKTMLDIFEGISLTLGAEEMERRIAAQPSQTEHPVMKALEAEFEVMDDESRPDR